PKMAGQGWRMLVQQLAVGRGIVLPSNALGGAQAAVYASGAYCRIRRQFGLPIGKFHGVGEALARMAGLTYAMDVHGGKAIMLGPKNYLARNYESVPIA